MISLPMKIRIKPIVVTTVNRAAFLTIRQKASHADLQKL